MPNSAGIKVLNNAWEAIRHRPALYVGPLDDPRLPFRLLGEALEVTRFVARKGPPITVSVSINHEGRLVGVTDNGPGWDVDPGPHGRRPAEVMLRELHACRGPNAEHPCNPGLVILVALSAEFLFATFRDGYAWEQFFVRGHAQEFARHGQSSRTGTMMTFVLDDTILPHVTFTREGVQSLAEDLRKDGTILEVS